MALLLGAVGWLGCGAPPHHEGGDPCGTSSRAAAERVLAVAEANRACASDADCVTVPVGATCFDACTRNVNQIGKGAVDRASTLVEASDCKNFSDARCTLVPPPCAPPTAPRCNAGKCE